MSPVSSVAAKGTTLQIQGEGEGVINVNETKKKVNWKGIWKRSNRVELQLWRKRIGTRIIKLKKNEKFVWE